MPWPIYFLLIPIEILGMFVRPFALTMRLAANMTGGHIALLAIMSFVFIFTEMLGRDRRHRHRRRILGAPGRRRFRAWKSSSCIVQAYVFTLLTAVFVGMAIHAHH